MHAARPLRENGDVILASLNYKSPTKLLKWESSYKVNIYMQNRQMYSDQLEIFAIKVIEI